MQLRAGGNWTHNLLIACSAVQKILLLKIDRDFPELYDHKMYCHFSNHCVCYLPLFIAAMIRDIFNLRNNPTLYKQCIDAITEYIREKYGTSVNAIVAPDAKGFLFGTDVALQLDLPFIPIRKAGKLSSHFDDLIQHSFENRKDEVSCILKCAIWLLQRMLWELTLYLYSQHFVKLWTYNL